MVVTMKAKTENKIYCMCALDGIIDMLGKKWVLLTINSISNRGDARFKDIRQDLNFISPSTLSYILKQLETKRILSRTTFSEIPPRVEYSLTSDGIELRNAVIPLLSWASKRDGYEEKSKHCDPSKYIM